MPRRWPTPAAGTLALVLGLSLALSGCDSGGRADAGGAQLSGGPPTAPLDAPSSPSSSGPNGGPNAGPSAAPSKPPSPTVAEHSAPAASLTTASRPAAPASSSAAGPPFTASVRSVTAADLGASWHSGCPVSPEQLREISLTYWGFDNAPHVGQIVVNASATSAVETAFKTLYLERFPIRSMRPVSEFGGSDDASMAVDNTSGFNCRNAVATGMPRWSAHAYGQAVDVNTVENPYLEGGQVLPPQGAPFARRSPYRAGMAVSGGQLVKAFAAVGWQWGGRWTGSPDYQHFSSTGG